MKTMILTKGKTTLVDDADYKQLSKWKWTAYCFPNGDCYAWRAKKIPKTRKSIHISMTSQIMGLEKGANREGIRLEVDHINHNTLDNRRKNLRICTRAENNANQYKRRNKTGYKGVTHIPEQWVAQIAYMENGKRYRRTIGRYNNPKDAAIAYNKEAKKIWGEFAYQNISS